MPGDKADEQVASGTVDQVRLWMLPWGLSRAEFDIRSGCADGKGLPEAAHSVYGLQEAS